MMLLIRCFSKHNTTLHLRHIQQIKEGRNHEHKGGNEMVTEPVKVHYFYDPMCGWCFGATPLIEALAESDKVEIRFHPGGMIQRQTIPRQFKDHILKSDQSIATVTGALFGEAYVNRLNGTDDLVFDSYLPTRAILVAEEMGAGPLTMLKAIQAAHFQQGKHVEQPETLAEIATSIGLDKISWSENMKHAESRAVEAIQQSQKLMGQYQVQGFPTLIAETSNGLQRLEHTSYYKNVPGWKNLLSTLS
jgi:putative protein-disulfide isomerase